MGSSASKAATGAASRRLPTHVSSPTAVSRLGPPPSSIQPSQAPSQSSPISPQSRDGEPSPLDDIANISTMDVKSPEFSARLHEMGVVNPNPFAGRIPQPGAPPASPTLVALQARQKLQQFVDGKRGGRAAGFVDMKTVCRMLDMRQKGSSASDIEAELDLPKGTAGILGKPGILSLV